MSAERKPTVEEARAETLGSLLPRLAHAYKDDDPLISDVLWRCDRAIMALVRNDIARARTDIEGER